MGGERFDEDANDVDVVVVGAGLTGLATAYEILRRRTGLQVLVLEGKDAPGGRILPADYSDAFHAHPRQQYVSRLLRTLRIATHPRRPVGRDERTIFAGGRSFTSLPAFHAAQANHFLRSVQAMTSGVTYGDSEDASTSAARLLARHVFFSRPRSVCAAILRNTCGTADLDETSALWLLATLRAAGGFLERLRVTVGDEERYFVGGGMRRVVQELEASINLNGGAIRCGEPVTGVHFNDDRAYVLTSKKPPIKCEYVVIAVPPPESSRIVVEPRLPGRLRDTLSSFKRAEKAFFTASYGRRFWSDERGRSGDVLAAPAAGTALALVYDGSPPAAHRGRTPRLAGFLDVSSPPAGPLLGLFETLRRCFESEEAHRWLSYDETGRADGAPMSVPRPAEWAASRQGPTEPPQPPPPPHRRRAPLPHGRLLFAASELAASWPGTADGAIEAGTHTARLILARSRPQALAAPTSTPLRPLEASAPDGAGAGSGGNRRAAILHRACLAVNVILLLHLLRAG